MCIRITLFIYLFLELTDDYDFAALGVSTKWNCVRD